MSNITTLTCSEPRALFWPPTLYGTSCQSATLLSEGGHVDVMCTRGIIPKDAPSNPYDFFVSWFHAGYLTEVNQTATCPYGQAMQLVAYFANKVVNALNLSVVLNPYEQCSHSSELSASYLDYKFRDSNTTVTLGLSNQVSSCFPPIVSEDVTYATCSRLNPFFRSSNQYANPAVNGSFCQRFTVVARSSDLGGLFALYCSSPKGETGQMLDSESQPGENATCYPKVDPKGEIYSAAYLTHSLSCENSVDGAKRYITLNRTVFPCEIPGSGQNKNSLDNRKKIMGIAIGVGVPSLAAIIGLVKYFFFRGKAPHVYPHYELVNYRSSSPT